MVWQQYHTPHGVSLSKFCWSCSYSFCSCINQGSFSREIEPIGSIEREKGTDYKELVLVTVEPDKLQYL